MASIHVKPSGALLVKWRVNGKQHARQFSDRSDAEVFKREKDGEAATRNVLRDTPGIPGWDDRTWTPEALEPEFAVARYLRDIIDRDHSLRVTSKDTYLHSIRNHIEGTDLGRADIRTVTVDQLRAFWAGMPTDRPGAVRNVRQLLSKAFNAAYRESIRDDNPLQRAGLKAPPKTRAVEIVPLTVDDLERLARNALNDRDRAAILLMGYGALRAGEVGGLREQDVDFTKCQLHLRQQTIRARSGKSVAPLKTAAARRTVTLPCSVTDELRKLGATKDGRLFYGVAGDLWTHQNVNNAVQRAAKRAGICARFTRTFCGTPPSRCSSTTVPTRGRSRPWSGTRTSK